MFIDALQLRLMAFYATLAAECGVAAYDKLTAQIILLVEGAIVSEQMKRHAGASQHAKQVAEILIDTYLQQSTG